MRLKSVYVYTALYIAAAIVLKLSYTHRTSIKNQNEVPHFNGGDVSLKLRVFTLKYLHKIEGWSFLLLIDIGDFNWTPKLFGTYFYV